MEPLTGVDVAALPGLGLSGITLTVGKSIQGTLEFERPAMAFDPRRIKDSSLGAHTYINGHGSTAIYRCHIGRFCSIGEDAVLGPPEHPVSWLSTHPFAFSRPEHVPGFYQVPEFARLAPDGQPAASGQPLMPLTEPHTRIGHDVWVGVGAFVKRGVSVGHGAIIAAHAVVTRDVPPYAIVAGMPARVLKLRFPEPIIERLLKLQWWQYDLAPHKKTLDFSNIESTLDRLEALQADGALAPLSPQTWRLVREGKTFAAQQLPESLY